MLTMCRTYADVIGPGRSPTILQSLALQAEALA